MFQAKLLPALLGLLLVLMMSIATNAQEESDPIILNIRGDLWAWTSADQPMQQLTDWGANEAPVISTDGRRAAYLSTSSLFVDWTQTATQNQIGGGYLPPQNIWVLELAKGETFRIADQPADAVWDGISQPGRYILRTDPSWSPHGTQIAWTERRVDTLTPPQEEVLDVVIYDFATETTRTLVSLPLSERLVDAGIFNVEWGRTGIAVSMGIGDFGAEPHLRLFDPAGEMLGEYIPTEDNHTPIFNSAWIQDGTDEYLFAPINPAAWLNWETEREETMPPAIELYSLPSPTGATFLRTDGEWFLLFPEHEPIRLGDDVRPYGISRDGQSVIYGVWGQNPETGNFDYIVVVRSLDDIVHIGRYANIRPAWGPTGWRVAE